MALLSQDSVRIGNMAQQSQVYNVAQHNLCDIDLATEYIACAILSARIALFNFHR